MPTPQESPHNRCQFALISNGRSPHNDNHQRILAAAQSLNWQTHCFEHSAIAMHAGTPVLDNPVCSPVASFDLVWVLGLGAQHDFLDRAQILSAVAPHKLVNSAQGMLSLHAKHLKLPYSPMSFSGNDADWLTGAARAHDRTGRWVVKPSAGSFGRGVQVADTADELHQILTTATKGGTYCVVQQFIDAIAAGETRTLVLNNRIIGSYLRIPDKAFLANLTQGAQAKVIELSDSQRTQVLDVAAALAERGIRFAAIDMAFPHLIEVNVANPGGLATLAGLSPDLSDTTSTRLRDALATLIG